MLFVGNCQYRGLGFAPVRRHDLADGVLDVRVVHGGRLARTRLLAAALMGTPRHSPVLSEARLRGLRIEGLPPGTDLAFDGEVGSAPGRVDAGEAERGADGLPPAARMVRSHSHDARSRRTV